MFSNLQSMMKSLIDIGMFDLKAIKLPECKSQYNTELRLLRNTDIFIILILVIASAFFIPLLLSHPRDTVVIYNQDNIIAEYPLDENRIFTIEGTLGRLEVEIKDRRVRVNSSTCPRQICVHTGWISKPYEQIICAPNRIFISIKSDSEELVDAVTR